MADPPGANGSKCRGDEVWLDRLCLALCLVAPVVYYFPLSIGAHVLGRFDAKVEAYPYFCMLTRGMRDGVDLWNPLSLMGARFLGSPVSPMAYPFAWLFAVSSSPRAFNLFLLAHYSMAATGMWIFLRELGLSRFAGLVGALTFAFSGFLTGHREHLMMIECVVWLPWCLVFWTRLCRTRRLVYLALLSACLGLTVLAAHFQTVLFTWIPVVAYVLFGRGLASPRDLCLFVLAATCAVLIGTIKLLPAWDLASIALRATRLEDAAFRTMGSFNPLAIGLLVAPFMFGAGLPCGPYEGDYWGPHPGLTEMACYVGIIPLVLASGTLCRLRRSQEVRMWWCLAVVAGVMALGRHTPVGRVLAHLPIYGTFRVPARHILEVTVSLSVLAAYGAQGLWEQRRTAEAKARQVSMGVCLLAIVGLVLVGTLARRVAPHAPQDALLPALMKLRVYLAGQNFRLGRACVFVPLIAVCLSWIALLLARATRYRFHRPLSCLIVIVVFLDLMSFGRFHDIPSAGWNPLDQQNAPEVEWLKGAQLRTQDYRVLPVFSSWEDSHVCALKPNQNLAYGIPGLLCYGPVLPSRYNTLFGLQATGELAGDSWVSVQDVVDWSGFCARLTDERDEAGSFHERLWSLLTAEMHQAIEKGTGKEPLDTDTKEDMVNALNEVIGRRDLCNAARISTIEEQGEVGRILQWGIESISDAHVRRLNRLALEAAYPDIVAKSTVIGPAQLIMREDLLSALGVSHLVWYGWPHADGIRCDGMLTVGVPVAGPCSLPGVLTPTPHGDGYLTQAQIACAPPRTARYVVQFDARSEPGSGCDATEVRLEVSVAGRQVTPQTVQVGGSFRCYQVSMPPLAAGEGRPTIEVRFVSASPFWVKEVEIGGVPREASLPQQGARYALEAMFPESRILRNPNCLPRVYFVPSVRPVSSLAAVARYLRSGTFDPWSTALVEGAVDCGEIRGGLEARIESYDADRMVVRTWNPQAGFLVIGESWDRYWQAEIDGKATEVYVTNGVARGILVPGGERQVVLRHVPSCALASLAVSICGWLLVLGLLVGGVMRSWSR